MEGNNRCERLGCLLWEVQLMHRSVYIILCFSICSALLVLSTARAQFNRFPPGLFTGRAAIDAGVAAGYTGPGDITSGAIAFYSAGRAYNAAYAAAKSPLADLVDTATGLLTCTLKVGTSGYADLTTAYCPTSVPTTNVVTWCTVTVGGCSITKLYDQTASGACTGSCDVVQATLANMPGLTFNAQNGLPCAAGTATGNLLSASNVVQAAPYSYTAVAKRTGSFTTLQHIFDPTNATNILSFRNVVNQARANNGAAVTLTVADGTFHAFIDIASATTPLFAADSSANTTTASSGTVSLNGPITIPGNIPLLSGFVCEAGIWPADLNSSYQAMLANMRSATNGWNF
jgi:hypothetical protein